MQLRVSACLSHLHICGYVCRCLTGKLFKKIDESLSAASAAQVCRLFFPPTLIILSLPCVSCSLTLLAFPFLLIYSFSWSLVLCVLSFLSLSSFWCFLVCLVLTFPVLSWFSCHCVSLPLVVFLLHISNDWCDTHDSCEQAQMEDASNSLDALDFGKRMSVEKEVPLPSYFLLLFPSSPFVPPCNLPLVMILIVLHTCRSKQGAYILFFSSFFPLLLFLPCSSALPLFPPLFPPHTPIFLSECGESRGGKTKVVMVGLAR